MPAEDREARGRTREAEREAIHAVAVVTLDAAALEDLGPQTMDRLADLVAAKLAERHAAGEAPLLTTTQAAKVAGVNVETLRRAVRRGALPVAGFVGRRPRLRREAVDAWVAGGCWSGAGPRPMVPPVSHTSRATPGRRRRVLGDALRVVAQERSAG